MKSLILYAGALTFLTLLTPLANALTCAKSSTGTEFCEGDTVLLKSGAGGFFIATFAGLHEKGIAEIDIRDEDGSTKERLRRPLDEVIKEKECYESVCKGNFPLQTLS